MIKNDSQAPSCTCPSGDGSLVHPCPAHPAVEQAGGDERAGFEAWLAQVMSHHFDPELDLAKYEDSGEYRYNPAADYWKAWQARAALAQPSPAQAEQPTADDYEEVLADHRRLVREMDVLLNGEACAAKQAMLCDLVSQVEAEVRKSGQPLLVSAERYRWLRNDDNWGADDSEGQGTSKWANLGELSGTDFDAYLDQLRGSNPVMDIDPEHSKAIAKRGRDAIVAQAEGAPVIGCLCGMPMTEGRHSPGGFTSLEEFAPNPAQAQSEQAEAERPEVVARVVHSNPIVLGQCGPLNANDELMTVAQHAASVARWAEMFNRVEQQRDAAMARVDALAVQVLKLGGTISFAHHRTDQAGQVPQAWLDVQAERRRQVEAEGWTPEHDDEHSHGQMARAAACYALAGSSAPNDGTAALLVSLAWPWDQQWWKPTSARRDLVKACALALAEIERLDRAAANQGGPRDA